METLGPNFILVTILVTTIVAIVHFIVIIYIIIQMDTHYFTNENVMRNKSFSANESKEPHLNVLDNAIIYTLKLIKIILGLCMLVSGIALLVLPGQGLITILIALSLLPFPGKSKIEKNLLSRRSVRSSLNWIRIKGGKEPFIFDKKDLNG
jgi:hypothetical protein